MTTTLDTRALERLLDDLKKLDGKSIKVGSIGERAAASFVSNDEHNNGEVMPFNVATLLSWHVYGLGVPKRDPIRPAVEAKKAEMKAAVRGAVAAMFTQGASAERVLEQPAELLLEEFQHRLEASLLYHQELADVTKENPFRDKRYLPLYDTHQIYNTFAFEWEGR